MSRAKWYVVYEGDEIVASGTARECAETLGCSEKTIKRYATCSDRNGSARVAVRVDLDEVDRKAVRGR